MSLDEKREVVREMAHVYVPLDELGIVEDMLDGDKHMIHLAAQYILGIVEEKLSKGTIDEVRAREEYKRLGLDWEEDRDVA